MKISTMLMTVAILIILGSLTAFDFNLKKVYDTGEYKTFTNGKVFTPIKNIEDLHIKGGNYLGIQVIYGEKEGVWIKKELKDKIKLEVIGKNLTIGLIASEEAKAFNYYDENQIFIFTKKLQSLIISPGSKVNGIFMNSGNTLITGYKLDSLNLDIGIFSFVTMVRMNINNLKANVGDKESGQSKLTVVASNTINNAEFNVPGKSELMLINPVITKTKLNIADSATVTMNGKAIQLIK